MQLRSTFRVAAFAALTMVIALALTPSAIVAAEGDAPTTQATQTTQSAGAPIALKKFTKKKNRSARSKSSRRSAPKASLAQRAKAGKLAEDAATKAGGKKLADVTSSARLTPVVANANAFYRPETGSTTGMAQADTPTTDKSVDSAASSNIELAEAAEVNEVDKAAWAPKDVPKLAPAILDSRAEMLSEDSRWANTSTIGKIFVAIGALLTIGSAIRMFVA